jgi:predicted metalloprotease with PDZ domain
MAGDRAVIANVLAGLSGYEAGLNAGDELVALDGLKLDAGNAMRRLNELVAGQTVTLSIFRREAMRTFSVTASRKPHDRYQLTDAKDASAEAVQLRRGWLRE